MNALPWTARAYLILVIALAGLALLGSGLTLPREALSFFLLLALADVLSVVRPVQLFYGSSMDVGSGILFTILVLFGPFPAMLVAAASKIVHGLVMRWQPSRMVFNVAQYILSLGVAGWILQVTRAYGVEPVGIIAAPLAYCTLQSYLVAQIISLTRQVSVRQVWQENYRDLMVPFVTLATLGAMTGYSINQKLWQFGLLLLALVTAYLTLRLSWLLRNITEEARNFQTLNSIMADLGRQAGAPISLAPVLEGLKEMVSGASSWATLWGEGLSLASAPTSHAPAEIDPQVLGAACHACESPPPAGGSWEPRFTSTGSGSLICLPLSVGGQFAGCLNAHVPQRVWPDRLGPVLTWLSQQVSSFLEKTQLYAQERSRAQALKSLMETIRTINAQLSLKPMLDIIVSEAAEVFHAPRAAILLSEDGSELEIRASVGLAGDAPEWEALTAQARRTLAGTAPGTGPLILPVKGGNGAASPHSGDLLQPLWEGQRLVGALVIGRASGQGPFREEETELAVSLASTTSIAVRNASLYEALEEKEQRLRHFLDRLIRAQEEERKMVAYDIHDGLLQYVIAADMHLKAFESSLLNAEPPPDLRRGLERLRSAIAEGRRVISDLRPSTLDDFGLVDTLLRHLERLRQDHGWEIRFEERLNGETLSVSMETTIFRIIQEALNNAQKHSRTKRVAVQLGRENGEIRLRVQDWGRGFDTTMMESASGVGLSAIQERADLMGGWCRIDSQPGRGTVVEVGLPLEKEGWRR